MSLDEEFLESDATPEMQVQDVLAPNVGDINAHLYVLFPPSWVQKFAGAQIEIAYGYPKPNKAKLFPAHDLKQASDFAAEMNRQGNNIWVGAELRKEDAPDDRCSTDNVLAGLYVRLDHDAEGAFEKAQSDIANKGLQPAFAVLTGTKPHQRGHHYFRIEAGLDDLRAAGIALHDCFGGDSIFDHPRVLRLSGTINYPSNDKRRRGYVEEIVAIAVAKSARTYSAAEIIDLAPGSSKDLAKKATIADRLDAVSPGAWHNNIRDTAAALVGHGVDPTSIVKLLSPHCKDGTSDYDLIELVGSAVAKFGGGKEEDALAELNGRYFVFRDGGKTLVGSFEVELLGKEEREVLKTSSFADFKAFYMNRTIDCGKDEAGKPVKKKLGQWWLEHAERRQYEGVVLAPGRGPRVGLYMNLWRGFGIQPCEGNWTLIRRHIHEVLCDCDDAAAEYVLAWIAWAVQNPGEQAGAAIVFRGKKGSGKGTLGDLLRRIFGQHGLHLTKSAQLTGRFNAHLRDAVFIFADEAYWPGDKSAEGTLKSLVTDETVFIEPKGRDGVSAKNMSHVMFASNEDWVVPATGDDRRWFVRDVNNKHAKDEAWFKPLHDEIANGGAQAFLHAMLNLELGDFHPRRIPAAANQIISQVAGSLTGFEAWYAAALDAGELAGADEAYPNRAPSAALIKAIKESGPRAKYFTDLEIGMKLRGVGAVPCKMNRGVTRAWKFPPLADCRQKWMADYPGWQFHEELSAWAAPPADFAMF